jgi:hypothetical protein
MKDQKNRVSIPQRLFNELTAAAEKHDLTVKQLISQLLEKEIVDIAHKDLFSPGLKWDVAKESIINARILEEDYPRLRKWLENNDNVQISTATEKNELHLMNWSILNQKS